MRDKNHVSEAPEQYEKETFVDRINQISFIVKEFQKLYDKTPITEHLFRAKVLKEIELKKNFIKSSGRIRDV
jgi:hypothetical protein